MRCFTTYCSWTPLAVVEANPTAPKPSASTVAVKYQHLHTAEWRQHNRSGG
jgi:hypothetical protein